MGGDTGQPDQGGPTLCRKGLHDMGLPNSWIARRDGKRMCRECTNTRDRRRYASDPVRRASCIVRAARHHRTPRGQIKRALWDVRGRIAVKQQKLEALLGTEI